MRLLAGTIFLLILLEVFVSDQYLDGILEMDAVFSVVLVAFVEPTILSLADPGLGRCLEKKAYLGLLEL